MRIELKHIVPAPLAGTFSLHPVWDQEIVLQQPEAYSVLAPSGKGKSTLLHLINGTRRDFSGTLLLDGRDSKTFSDKDWAELRAKQVSTVFQDLRLFPQLSAKENIQIQARLGAYLDENTWLGYAEEMGVSALLDKPCGKLSFGQQQRIAILRALVQPFEWLLMDEPFSHLDEENIRIICGILEKELKERQAGLLLSSLGTTYPYPFTQSLLI
ncbi:MAG: ATP-binding cassette domain-containing protein [Bacteroidetes bacterium]|nr:MAG: ATP-binding cassette domain-containing protein [Bacteroidota bacterium]